MEQPPPKRPKLYHTENHDGYHEPSTAPHSAETPLLCSSIGFRNVLDDSPPSAVFPENVPAKSLTDAPASIICFGMLVVPVTPSRPTPSRGIEAIRLGEGGQLWAGEVVATLSARDAQLLELLHREHLELEISITATEFPLRRQSIQHPPSAHVVLYGPEDLGPDLKDVLNRTGFFVQDPVGASRDVVYLNPQRLFNTPGARTSHALFRLEGAVEQQEVLMVDILAQFTTQVDLVPTEGSKYLLTPLKFHQKQALTFMRNRESGWEILGDRNDVWSMEKKPNGETRYINNIDNSSQFEQPPAFRGGILADNMGSGKSLSVIALITKDKDCWTSGGNHPAISKNKNPGCNATLIILPAQLLLNWHCELNKHIGATHFRWQCHHGSSKIRNVQDLEMLDIVLVTYPTLAAEWRTNKETSIMFTARWNRVVLDEAHYIKDSSAVTTKAVCDIESLHRWAITGTPIQNNLSDLQSLLKFLRVYPYDDKDTFQRDFTSLWTSGKGLLATNRLKQLLGYIMLRRSSNHIELPARKDLKLFLGLDEPERKVYTAAKEKTLDFIDDVLSSQKDAGSYKNAVQKINHLRWICNHGLWQPDHDHKNLEPKIERFDMECWSTIAAQKTFSRFPSLGLPAACVQCSSVVDVNIADDDSQLLGSTSSTQLYLTKCSRLWCKPCHDLKQAFLEPLSFCDCDTKCPVAAVQFNDLSRFPSPLTVAQNGCQEQRPYPTKIRAILHDLQNLTSSTKSIVFSFRKSSLDIARLALTESGLSCVQVDGKIKPKDRGAIFEKFQTDAKIQVLLLSLTCGAVGLTLTAASRVYLLEPQWNMSLEEQALARIHRIGQKQDVTTIRFLIKDSIEQYVTDVQDKKKDLVSILLSPNSQISHQRLQELRDWLK